MSELDGLLAGNSLYARPTGVTSVPDLQETGYGYRILLAAGRPISSPWNSSQGSALMTTSFASSNVWAPWFVAGAAGAEPSKSIARAAVRVKSSLNQTGYFTDSSDTRPDDASRLAATAAALDVLSSSGSLVGADDRSRVAEWVTGVAAAVRNPYQACNAATALGRLHQAVPNAFLGQDAIYWAAAGHLPASVRSYEDALDLYGIACTATAMPKLRSTPAQRAMLSTLRETLGVALREPRGDLAATYHLVMAWGLLGGDVTRLEPAVDMVESRIDPSSGLVSRPTERVGTVDDSYSVAKIRRLAGVSELDDRVGVGVRLSLDTFRQRQTALTKLRAAVVLQLSGSPDAALTQEALAAARLQIPVAVTRDNVVAWAAAQEMFQDLGEAPPAANVRRWSTTDRQGRYDAWLVSEHNRVLDKYSRSTFWPEVVAVPEVIAREGEGLSMKEIRAAVGAVAEDGGVAATPQRLTHLLDGMRGCEGHPLMFRPDPRATGCDLSATADGRWLESFLDGKQR